MTVYAYNHGGHAFLWGDTPDEALILAAAIGHDLQQPPWSWDCYRLTEDQWIDALVAGAEPLDRFGPAEWCARRASRTQLLDRIACARTTGCA